MMMKITVSLILSTLFVGFASASPAFVWRKERMNDAVVHNSEKIKAEDLFSQVSESSSLAVVFLMRRFENGDEGLSTLAGKGMLPGVEAKYEDADEVHHYVTGVEGTRSVLRDCGNALLVSLSELNSKLTDQIVIEVGVDGQMMPKAVKEANKRARALTSANTLVVDVKATEGNALDKAVVMAIENGNVESVVLTAVRSRDEVKIGRDEAARNRFVMQQLKTQERRRRLEDQADQEEGDDDGNNNEAQAGVHFVAMTPNIFAGLLFTAFFMMIAYTGLSCMGAISGQDVYVKKMPTIGKEA